MEHPISSNAFDSLGEAYAKDGDRVLAIKSYATAVLLDPANGHAVGSLKELGFGRALWFASFGICAMAAFLVGVILVKCRRSRPKRG
jgi:cytochrome c-type biogenesis protein CcmH/NrfG